MMQSGRNLIKLLLYIALMLAAVSPSVSSHLLSHAHRYFGRWSLSACVRNLAMLLCRQLGFNEVVLEDFANFAFLVLNDFAHVD